MMYYIGIDLGGTSIKVGLVTREGEILIEKRRKTEYKRGHMAIITDMAELIKEVLEEKKVSVSEVGGIGIGCPGAIESEAGKIIYSNNLRWENVEIIKEINRLIPEIPAYVTNDANAAALGEATFGAGKEYGDSVLVTLGTGVGGGIVIWDKMFEGNKSNGAEIGHMVICAGGEQCTCGRKGCFEAYSSATALIRHTKEVMEQNKDSKMWERAKTLDEVDGLTAFETSKIGDKAAQEVVDWYVMYLGEGIVNIANVLRPEVVMLGGGVSAQGDYLTKPVQAYLDKFVYGKTRTARVYVMTAKLGNSAGIIGAGTLAMHNYKYND